MGWIEWLLAGEPDFVRRSQCGDWPAWLSLAYRAGNWAIALSYFLIPAAIYWLYRRRRESLPRPEMLLCFVAFIFLCGCTHALDALAFAWPAYRFATLVTALTAAVSMATALMLPSAVRHLARLPSPEEHARALDRLELESQARRAFQAQLEGRNRDLRRSFDAMREQFEDLRHRVVTEDRYEALRRALHDARDAASRYRDEPPEAAP